MDRFDAVPVKGDTTCALAGGLCTIPRKILVGHIKAGLCSHDRYSAFSKKINRVMLSLLANWHFAPAEFAASLLPNTAFLSKPFTIQRLRDAINFPLKIIKQTRSEIAYEQEARSNSAPRVIRGVTCSKMRLVWRA